MSSNLIKPSGYTFWVADRGLIYLHVSEGKGRAPHFEGLPGVTLSDIQKERVHQVDFFNVL